MWRWSTLPAALVDTQPVVLVDTLEPDQGDADRPAFRPFDQNYRPAFQVVQNPALNIAAYT